jgi:four helix bundle protein
MLDQHEQLRARTKDFSFRVIRLVKALPTRPHAEVIGKQLLRSATSVAANYRAVGCCRTKPEFVTKLRLVLEEADESVYWLECIREAGLVHPDRLEQLLSEANQLVAIFSASLRTASGRAKQMTR